MMQPKNLWGEMDLHRKLPDPVLWIQKQAELVEELTGGELVGRVRRRVSSHTGGMFWVDLAILAPYLENYTAEIVNVTYDPTIYPITLTNAMTMEQHACESEGEFIEKLGEILSSEKVRDYISALITHSRQGRKYDHPRRALM